MNTNEIKNIIDEIIYESIIGKNSFKVGDLVKLRPDILNYHQSGPRFSQRFFYERLKTLKDKMGKIVKLFPSSKNVNVEYKEPWDYDDEFGRETKGINIISVNYTDLVPYDKNPVAEGILGMINPQGVGSIARKLIDKFNHNEINRSLLIKNMEELMWRSRTQDPDNYYTLKTTVDRLKAGPQNTGIKLKFEGFGYVSDKDMKKDPKHIKGERWRIKFQSSSDLKKHGNTEKSKVSENEIRNVIQELLKEMWTGWEEDIKEVENPDVNYIIWAKSGPATTYYVETSNGSRMIQNAQSMAVRFKTEEEVRRKIFQLKQKYKGIKNFDFERVSAKKNWEDVWKSHGPRNFRLGHEVFKPVKKGEEYIVRWVVNGKTDGMKSYYTTDKKDAEDTYVQMFKDAEFENKKLGLK